MDLEEEDKNPLTVIIWTRIWTSIRFL